MTVIHEANARELNMLIRRKKMTREEICIAYNCSNEEFDGVLSRVYTSAKAFKDISRVLKNNARDAERAKNLHAKNDDESEPNLEMPENSAETEPKIDEKEALTLEKNELEAELIPLEQSYQEDLNARRQILQEARSIKSEMEKLRKLAKEMMDEKYVPLMEKNNELVVEINQKGEKIREKRVRYDAINTRLIELDNVYVIVCDGDFLPETETGLDFNGWEAIYSNLLLSEDPVFDLKKSQLKTVAESVAARDNSSRTLVFEFDSKELEHAYGAIDTIRSKI